MRELIVCPICNRVIFSHQADPTRMHARISSRSPYGANMLTEMMLAAELIQRDKVLAAEEACRSHFAESHPWRLRLWERFRKPWLMTWTWPWRRSVLGDGEFEWTTRR